MRYKYARLEFWKRNVKFAIVHVLNICFIGILFFYLCKLEKAQIVSEGRNEALPSKTTEYFTVDGVERMDFSFLLNQKEMEHCTLLSHAPSTSLNYEVLFTSGEKDIFGGEYFKEDDFTNGTVSMVLGSYLEWNGHEANEVKELALAKGKEVVRRGELALSANAAWNYSLFYTQGQIEEVDVSAVLALSSSKRKYLDLAKEALFQEISTRGGRVAYCDYKQVEYRNFFDDSKINEVLFWCVMSIMFLSECVSVYFVYLWRRPLRTVQFLFGKNRIILGEIQKDILGLLVDTICGGLLLWIVIRKYTYESYGWLLLSMFLMLVLGCLAIGTTYLLALRAVKERKIPRK